MRELNVNFSFNEDENSSIIDSLLKIDASPYKFYPAFKYQVRELISALPQLQRLRDYLEHWKSISNYENPFVFLENCPIDADIPVFDNADPVREKYIKKKTFVAEGFLQIYADLTAQHPISYLNVNDGDIFQDIFPKEDLKYSQSQKALGPIYFHKDLANHFVRPDFVNILSLRSSNDNHIYTTFVSNHDILTCTPFPRQTIPPNPSSTPQI